MAVIDLFKKYGAQYDVDYLLMAAQGYQESTLDQNAKSQVGAIGVMQVMPATGKELKVGDITQIDANIHAGVKYMRFMMDRVLQGRADGQPEQGPDDLRVVQRRARTHQAAPARNREAGPQSQRLVRERRACRVSADRPRDRHLRQQHLQVLHRLQAGDGAHRTTQRRKGADREGTVKFILLVHRRISVKHLARVCALSLAVYAMLAIPPMAFAQSDKWDVGIAPLYFWAATTDGNLAINGTRDVPVYMDFADAKSKLAGAFSFHGEARRGQWGVLGDVNFIRLSTDTSYTTPILNAPIAGTFQFDQTIFNGKAIFEVKPGSRFLLVGGIRTLTMSPNAHFTGPVGGQLADRHQHDPCRRGRRLQLPPQAQQQGRYPHAGRHRGRLGVHLERGRRRRVPHQALDRAGRGLQRAPHRHRHRAQERKRACQRRAVHRDAGRSGILADVSLEREMKALATAGTMCGRQNTGPVQ